MGQTLTPGLYESVGAVSNTGTLILDGQSNAAAVFVLQVNGALTAAASSHVTLINGALASRVLADGRRSEHRCDLDVRRNDHGARRRRHRRRDCRQRSSVLGAACIGLDSNEFYSTPPVVTITGGATVITTNTTPTISGR